MFLEYYGLRDQPFGNSPDPRYLYFSNTHREALASLFYGIETGCGFLSLIAPPGMGKTTLLFHLVEKLRTTAQTVFLFQTQCGSREFLRYLLTNLGVDASAQDMANMHESLNTVLLSNARSGRRFVLIIDEAQNLEESVLETVRLLSDFETPHAKLMQIVLAGQPQLADKLSSSALTQLRQRISISARLHPFTRVGTMVYIEYRLSVAGYVGPPLFSYEAIELIAVHSGGIPRNINNICFNALTLAYAKRQKVIDASIVSQVLVDLDMNQLTSHRMAPAHTAWDPLTSFDGLDPIDESSYQEFRAAVHVSWGDRPGEGAEQKDDRRAVRSQAFEQVVPAEVHLGSTRPPHVSPSNDSPQVLPNKVPMRDQEGPGLETGPTHILEPSIDNPRSEPNAVHNDDKEPTPITCTQRMVPVSMQTPVSVEQLDEANGSEAVSGSFIAGSPVQKNDTGDWARAVAAAISRSSTKVLRLVSLKGNRFLNPDLTKPGNQKIPSRQSLAGLEKVLLIPTAAIVLLALTISATMPARQDRRATAHAQVLSVPTTAAIQSMATARQGASFGAQQNAVVVPASMKPMLATSGLKSGASLADSNAPQAATAPKQLSHNTGNVVEELSRPIVNRAALSAPSDAPLAPALQSSTLSSVDGIALDAEALPTSPGGHLEVPKLVASPPPYYPPVAVSQKVQGVVVIDALVDATGKVSDTKVMTGSALLAQAATDAVRRWTYEPARLNGEPIAVHTKVYVNFQLH